jgi:hypothetical protein
MSWMENNVFKPPIMIQWLYINSIPILHGYNILKLVEAS